VEQRPDIVDTFLNTYQQLGQQIEHNFQDIEQGIHRMEQTAQTLQDSMTRIDQTAQQLRDLDQQRLINKQEINLLMDQLQRNIEEYEREDRQFSEVLERQRLQRERRR
jgi:methyl-accepting chemotaxis protein